jgi:glutathione peroxidase
MPHLLTLLLFAAVLSPPVLASDCPASLDFQMRPLASDRAESLCERYAGKVLLVVNTASRCGFTPQYEGLDTLYDHYRNQGLVVVGFPSNDFAQELEEEQAIQNFCQRSYGVRFPMYEKIKVSGTEAHPFYRELAAQGGGAARMEFLQVSDRSSRSGRSPFSHPRPDRMIRNSSKRLKSCCKRL